MKTLGICIPTYKRPEFLRRCVLSAIQSAQGRPIQVVIADDSCDDTNAAVLAALTREFPFVRSHANAKNLGIDLNIQNVVDLCDCDFAWLIGEDDEFLPGAVCEMLDLVQQVSQPFICANYQYVSEDHKRVLQIVLPDALDGEVPAARFIAESLWSIGFIGSCVIRREAWAATSPEDYLGTYFTHVGRVVDMLARDPAVWMSARPSVANRAQGDDTFTWKKDAFGVFQGFERMCRIGAEHNPSLRDATRLASENYRRKSGYLTVKSTFRLRSEGAFDLRQFRVYVAPSSSIALPRKAWLLFLALMPRLLLKPLALAYIAHLRRRKVAVAASPR